MAYGVLPACSQPAPAIPNADQADMARATTAAAVPSRNAYPDEILRSILSHRHRRCANEEFSEVPSLPEPAQRLQDRLRHLYEGRSAECHRFRYGLLAFDSVTILFIVATSFLERSNWVERVDVAFGIVILADFAARLFISRRRLRELLYPTTWADIAAIVSFLAPLVGEGAGFLRILRTLRFLRSYQLLARLRADSAYFREHEDVVIAVANFFVFLFVMTGFVYETQHLRNPQIENYVDALYFTVTTLTTTGFGDITLTGTPGRLISVAIMIFGVTLFFGLARAVLRPNKVRFQCPNCGLLRHEPDAVHCKACGVVLNIPDEGR